MTKILRKQMADFYRLHDLELRIFESMIKFYINKKIVKYKNRSIFRKKSQFTNVLGGNFKNKF